MEALLGRFPEKREWSFDKRAKRGSFWRLIKLVRKEQPDLVIMEGTGIAGGLICLLGRWIWNVPYVFSSGDAVGPFVRSISPIVGLFFEIYERLLCRWSAGFIGWTPYLTGRALTFGSPRAMTAAGWPIGETNGLVLSTARSEWRKKWGIPENTIVIGLVGSLVWNAHRQYCYGLDLVSAAVRLAREDLIVVVVGEGDGLDHLRNVAGKHLGTRVRLPGPVALKDVMSCLASFDVGALPQSTDGVGSFRYTTKLSEYAAAKLPVITSRIPVAYDLGIDWMWRLPGSGPWEKTYIDALTGLLEQLNESQFVTRRKAIPEHLESFDREVQVPRVTGFIHDILEELEGKPSGRIASAEPATYSA